ncbi:pentatricopeptide repeat-containing protein, partial [Tanacetum coccineum]
GVGPLSGKGPRVIVSTDVSILPQPVFVHGGATGAALRAWYSYYTSSHTIMIRGLCDEGRVHDAFKLVREMTDKGLVPDTQAYNTLIKGFCDEGLLDEARLLKLEVSGVDEFPDTSTYTILISGMCRYRDGNRREKNP